MRKNKKNEVTQVEEQPKKEKTSEKKFASISFKSFLSSLIIIVVFMIVTYILTFVLPAGAYPKDEAGKIIGEFKYLPNVEFPFWKFILSPFLVLGSDGNILLIAILVFLCIIGGVFEALTKCKFMEYLLKKLVSKFYTKRYALIYILVLFFMLLGSFVGTFEEVIPMIPFVCALTTSLGFDNLVGLGVSLLAAGSGFACGIMNPFTIGIAQKIANVPLFSGAWIRIVTFIIIYAILTTFLLLHARRIEKKNANQEPIEFTNDFVKDKKMDKAIWAFGGTLGFGLLLVICSTFLTALQDYTLIIIALCFLIGGIAGAAVAGMKPKEIAKSFGKGTLTMLPGVAMILLASSIRYILTESYRIDTLIYNMMNATQGLSPYVLILFIYVIVFFVEIFIASGSAKAFLLMPLLLPIGTNFGISANLICLAYIFGDGFSNYLYPSDAALIISLKLSDYTYIKYLKHTWIYHLLSFVITAGILLLGVAIGY